MFFRALLLLAVVATLILLLVATRRRRKLQPRELPVVDCATRFYAALGPGGRTHYCVENGSAPATCELWPVSAIVRANELPRARRCSRVVWNFPCEKGLLCALERAGYKLSGPGAADRLAQRRCGSPRRLVC